jgi:hypothetical protein
MVNFKYILWACSGTIYYLVKNFLEQILILFPPPNFVSDKERELLLSLRTTNFSKGFYACVFTP